MLRLPTIPFTVPNLITVAISLTALFLTARNYLRKAGIYVRGVFTTASSRDCDDQYVAEFILENLKDRAVTIFAIYLKIGHHCYLELENLEDKPLILKAFETYQKHCGPIEFYSVNMHRVDLNELFADRKIKKRIILSTSDGKYTVPSNMRRWSPVHNYFQNYMTILPHPVRTSLKGTDLGGNVKFVVEFIPEKGKEEIVPIHARDYELKIFRNFSLTREALSSKEALEQFFEAKKKESKLQSGTIVVHDMQEWREKKHDSYKMEPFKIQYVGAFEYHVVGRIYSKYSNWKTDRENRRLRLKNQQPKK
ncbi:MAG TPA: hypothetical protein VFP59_15290 [Candidatus Angelobacter sp.]|nr:hypothetical protein [Candidatus Angelobacter sp.]